LIDYWLPISIEVDVRGDIEIRFHRSQGEGEDDGVIGLVIGDVELVYDDGFGFGTVCYRVGVQNAVACEDGSRRKERDEKGGEPGSYTHGRTS